MTTHQQEVIEMIVIQSVSMSSKGSYVHWRHMENKPPFEESWFWEQFEDMVDQTVMQLRDSVEAWVTVQYEEDIIDKLQNEHGL